MTGKVKAMWQELQDEQNDATWKDLYDMRMDKQTKWEFALVDIQNELRFLLKTADEDLRLYEGELVEARLLIKTIMEKI